jgi:transposase
LTAVWTEAATRRRVDIKLGGNELKLERDEEAITRSLELAACSVVTTGVASAAMSAEQVHDSYIALEKVERDFRTLKTGLLEVHPVRVRKESRTRGHVFCCLLALKLSREMERRLRAAFGTTATQPQGITLPDARQQEILQALGFTLPVM